MLEHKGFRGLKRSHGFIVQHLLKRPHGVSELAKLLGVTQQGVSKMVVEMEKGGYLEDVESTDARVRTVKLSARGRAAVDATRKLRRALDEELKQTVGERALRSAHRVLEAAVDRLGAREVIKKRRVRP